MKKVKILFLGIIVLLSISAIGGYFFLNSKLAQRSGSLKIANLKKPVNVTFDKWGIPHIYAKNELDAYRALGYLHAQDRLFQMELIRRLAKGELSEILGDKLLPIDKLFRTLRIRRYAKEYEKNTPKNTKVYRSAQAYLDGVNQFIKKGKTPIEFTMLGIPKTPFTFADSISIGGYMAYSFAAAFRTDPLLSHIKQKLGNQYLKDLAFSTTPIKSFSKKQNITNKAMLGIAKIISSVDQFGHGLGLFEGSNAWLVSGKLTKSGKPILANDPHIGFAAPSVWYEAHLVTPTFELYGHHLAGVPFAMLGHNKKMGWGITMFQNDDIDFFREKTNPNNKNQVLSKGKWTDLTIEKEVIKVKGKPSVTIQVRSSHHGPILTDVLSGLKGQKEPISIWWAYLEKSNNLMQAFYDLPRATTVQEAGKAASKIHSPGLNIMYANQKGDIAWWAVGKIPKRPSHVNSHFILDGTGKDDFLGFLDFSKNPQMINPPSGFIFSGNHQPQDLGNGVVAGYYNLQYRAMRLKKLLQQKKSGWTKEDMKKIQLDTTTSYAQDIHKIVIPLLKQNKLLQKNNVSQQALQKIQEWKGNYDLNEVAPTIFARYLYFFAKNTFADELGKDYFKILLKTRTFDKTVPRILKNQNSVWWDIKSTKKKETRKEIVAKAWLDTIQSLEKELGSNVNKWQWKRVHQIEYVHAIGRKKPFNYIFNVGTFAVAGGKEVPNNIAYSHSDKKLKITYGPSTRRIIDFANPEKSLGINPTGQSGYFFDKFYKNQAKMYVKGQYRQQLFSKKDILANQSSKLILLPE